MAQKKNVKIPHNIAAAILITLSLMHGAFIIAQAYASDLPPEAETAIKEGGKAAELKQWEAAIEHFNNALINGGERSPRVNYFLALAYDNAGGRDLHAIARYRAFLSLSPDSPKAGEIRQRIALLETRAINTVRNFISLTDQALSNLGSSALGNLQMTESIYHPLFRAKLWLAKKENRQITANELIQNDDEQYKLKCLGIVYAEMRDYTDAERIADDLVQRHFLMALSLHREIAKNKFDSGDTAGALASVSRAEELITTHFKTPPSTLLAESAGLRAEFGDLTGAERLLKQAKEFATGVPPDAFFEGVSIKSAIGKLALAYFRAGDPAGTDSKLAQLLEEGDINGHDHVIMEMSRIYAGRGESDLAFSTKKRIRESFTSYDPKDFIKSCAGSGCNQINDEFTEWIELISSSPLNQFSKDLRVMLKEAKEGDERSQLWFKMISEEKAEHPEESVRALASLAGDFVGALQALDEKEAKWQQLRK
ncbi:MAG: hypothetical protein HY807_09835 [Nitrospirae bacterium]|nr:hypothetical protein [Nitrospirota bacterium]